MAAHSEDFILTASRGVFPAYCAPKFFSPRTREETAEQTDQFAQLFPHCVLRALFQRATCTSLKLMHLRNMPVVYHYINIIRHKFYI